ESTKVSHLLHEYQKPSSSWSEWSEPGPCDSSCLYGPSKRLSEGSTGLQDTNPQMHRLQTSLHRS
ncbi:hypothetical protein DOY81_015189, partial [Sarcophaga bullata]